MLVTRANRRDSAPESAFHATRESASHFINHVQQVHLLQTFDNGRLERQRAEVLEPTVEKHMLSRCQGVPQDVVLQGPAPSNPQQVHTITPSPTGMLFTGETYDMCQQRRNI